MFVKKVSHVIHASVEKISMGKHVIVSTLAKYTRKYTRPIEIFRSLLSFS